LLPIKNPLFIHMGVQHFERESPEHIWSPFQFGAHSIFGKLFERASARDEQLGLLGEWSEDIDCVRPLYLAASQQTKRTTKRGIGERWRSGGRISPLDTSALEAYNNCGSGLTEKV
jgi:hypothetical protein